MVRFDGIKSYYDFRQVTAEQLKTEAQKLMDVRKYFVQELHIVFSDHQIIPGVQSSL